jgi:hydrogenase nickel incorporation protein HypA/HybF
VHELSICGSIAGIVTRHAAGRPVKLINVRAGQLRQIVPDTLVYCWELVSAETPLAGSRISIEIVPARIRCRTCEHITEVGDIPVFACGSCGGFDAEVVSGEEFLITSLELECSFPAPDDAEVGHTSGSKEGKEYSQMKRGRAPDGPFPSP